MDALLLSVWKLMKYSTVKAAVFREAQTVENQKKMKLLKVSTTRWLSHGDSSKRLVSRFTSLKNALDALIQEKTVPEVKGIRDSLLEPNTILMLLLLCDLIYGEMCTKFSRLNEEINKMLTEDGKEFSTHAKEFLSLSKIGMAGARRLRQNDLFDENENDEDILKKIEDFKVKIKIPFLEELSKEINTAIQIDDPIFLAFDAFNVNATLTKEQIHEKVSTLKAFYGHQQQSKFEGNVNFAEALIDSSAITDESIDSFFKDFRYAVQKETDERNAQIRKLVENKQLDPSNIAQYKDEHPLHQSKVYRNMYGDRREYKELMKLFKFSLLIPPSTANVERGFSMLTMMLTKQRNLLSPSSIDKIMRLIWLGPQNFDDETWEKLVDDYRDSKERRIAL